MEVISNHDSPPLPSTIKNPQCRARLAKRLKEIEQLTYDDLSPEEAERDRTMRERHALEDAARDQRQLNAYAANPLQQAPGENTLEWCERLSFALTRDKYHEIRARFARPGLVQIGTPVAEPTGQLHGESLTAYKARCAREFNERHNELKRKDAISRRAHEHELRRMTAAELDDMIKKLREDGNALRQLSGAQRFELKLQGKLTLRLLRAPADVLEIIGAHVEEVRSPGFRGYNNFDHGGWRQYGINSVAAYRKLVSALRAPGAPKITEICSLEELDLIKEKGRRRLAAEHSGSDGVRGQVLRAACIDALLDERGSQIRAAKVAVHDLSIRNSCWRTSAPPPPIAAPLFTALALHPEAGLLTVEHFAGGAL